MHASVGSVLVFTIFFSKVSSVLVFQNILISVRFYFFICAVVQYWSWWNINAQSASFRSLVATEHIAAALAPYMHNAAAAAANSVEQEASDVVVENTIFDWALR